MSFDDIIHVALHYTGAVRINSHQLFVFWESNDIPPRCSFCALQHCVARKNLARKSNHYTGHPFKRTNGMESTSGDGRLKQRNPSSDRLLKLLQLMTRLNNLQSGQHCLRETKKHSEVAHQPQSSPSHHIFQIPSSSSYS